MRTPREAFLLTPAAAEWKKIVAGSTALDTACDYALLQLITELAPNTTPSLPTDPYIGIDANAQRWGAIRVLELLKTLHEPIKPPVTPKRETIYH